MSLCGSSNNPAVAAIEYALSKDCHGSEREFLNCWLHGEFDAIRREWENVPDEVFIGADHRLERTSENGSIFNQDIPTAVREAVLVAIVECFEKHPEDISSTFTLTELVEVRDGTQHLLDENVQVESVYKRGFDALKK